MCARPADARAAPVNLEASPIVAAEVLAVTVTAAAELAELGYSVTGPGIVSIVAAWKSLEDAEVVRENLIEAGVYPVKVI